MKLNIKQMIKLGVKELKDSVKYVGGLKSKPFGINIRVQNNGFFAVTMKRDDGTETEISNRHEFLSKPKTKQ